MPTLDFSTVNLLNLPEGAVKNITDSNNNSLWTKPVGWTTIWEGTATVSAPPSGQSYTTTSITHFPAFTGTAQLRVT